MTAQELAYFLEQIKHADTRPVLVDIPGQPFAYDIEGVKLSESGCVHILLKGREP